LWDINDEKYKHEREEIEKQATILLTPFEMNIPHYNEYFQNLRTFSEDAKLLVDTTQREIKHRVDYIKDMHQNVLSVLKEKEEEKEEELSSDLNRKFKKNARKEAIKILKKKIEEGWMPKHPKKPTVWMKEEADRIYKKKKEEWENKKKEYDHITFEAFKNEFLEANIKHKTPVVAGLVKILEDFVEVANEMIKLSLLYQRPVGDGGIENPEEVVGGSKKKRKSRKKLHKRHKRHKRHKTLKGGKKKKRKSRKKRHKTLKGKKSKKTNPYI
jgi:hypothetical protein